MPAPLRPVVIAPTFNNASTLPGVLERIERLGLPICVVNDGATDGTVDLLQRWAGGNRRVAVHVVAHVTNCGKSAALRTGFARATASGYTHAVSIDTDGQLDPEDIPALLGLAERDPTALVLGYRNASAHNGPARSLAGRRLSNLGIRLACGARVEDSQCGLRVYPLGMVSAVVCHGQRFVFETEIITRASWAGCRIAQAPVNSRYFPPTQRVSHFRPVIDTLRCLALHARLLSRSILPWPHPALWRSPAGGHESAGGPCYGTTT